jgi:hypothetical protein
VHTIKPQLRPWPSLKHINMYYITSWQMMSNHYHLLLLTLLVFIYVKSRDDKYMKGDITVYAFPIYKEWIYCFFVTLFRTSLRA